MLILRVVFLDFLLCVHVIGAAVLFRRWFPRESPWFGFIVPILALLTALNFIEHYVALPSLGWMLPLTVGASLWTIFRPGYSWHGLRLPTILFAVTFSFTLLLKSLSPDIINYTESAGDMTRILNYSLGGTLPPIDCWLPPYDYGGYYSFQQYGAAILKRLFYLDLGTSCNLAYAFLLAWTCLAGAGVAHSISGRMWIALVTVIVLMAGSTGSVPFLFFYGHGNDYALSTSLNTAWDDPSRNPFTWICAHDKYHPVLTLVSPMYSLYWNEFHATLGGAFATMAALFACSEVCKPARSDWAWVGLFVIPMVSIITSAWFFPIILFFCAGSGVLALLNGRRPLNVKFVSIASAVGVVFVWPSVYSLLGNSSTQNFFWTRPEEHTPFWMFVLQWWPICLPWLSLCCIWKKMNLMTRWIHASIPILLLAIEFVTFGTRSLTTEKMWGELYATGLVTLFPVVFMQRNIPFILLNGVLLLFSFFCFGMWMKYVYYDPIDGHNFCRLQGDFYIQADMQTKRLLQVLSRLHGATVLPGKSYWAYNEDPTIIGFSENRCYVAYTYQEGQCGHADEADYRSRINNSFYSGAMTDPLPFLRANHIAAVVIWREDAIPDTLLEQFKMELDPEFVYVDCKGDGPNNIGVFMRQTPLSSAPPNLSTADLNPVPTSP
jgi:hypothetical protein